MSGSPPFAWPPAPPPAPPLSDTIPPLPAPATDVMDLPDLPAGSEGFAILVVQPPATSGEKVQPFRLTQDRFAAFGVQGRGIKDAAAEIVNGEPALMLTMTDGTLLPISLAPLVPLLAAQLAAGVTPPAGPRLFNILLFRVPFKPASFAVPPTRPNRNIFNLLYLF